MICVIRIKGQVGIKKEITDTLYRLRIRKKYACVLLEPTAVNLGMIKKVKDFVAYGEISEDLKKELIQKRGIKDVDGKLKPFFRLHPPRGGIKSKVHYPKGVLGNHKKKLNELLQRML
ncbi:uL30 family ribosomal protein [Candidatus Pacearchaeota archaeon]|nr:uL30 family ribosomal protein [Candidatus Pacearchaeota archaeon]